MSYKLDKVYNNLQYKVTTHTSVQQGSSTAGTATVVSGSTITYEPSAGSSKVIYEISYYAERKGGLSQQVLKLQEEDGGSWSEINAKFIRTFSNSGGGGQTNRWNARVRYVIPTWSGSKNLRLVTIGRYAGHADIDMHQLTDWDGSSASDQFCNTNLIIYSV